MVSPVRTRIIPYPGTSLGEKIEKCHLVARGLGNGGGRYGLAELYFGIMAARVGFVYNVDRGYEEKFYQRWCRNGSDARACIGQWRQEAMV